MKLEHLKEWINSLPEEVLDHEVVFRKFVIIENDSENLFAKDINVAACGIDDDTKEAYFCDKESASIVEGNIYEDEERTEDDE
jgi:hypothetical protein